MTETTPPAVLRVYIAGPYSADPQACTAAAIAAGTAILDAGHAPLVPHLAHYWETVHGPRPYEDWMRIDLAWVEAADVVLRLPGRSPGADREVAVAVACGIPVVADVAGLVEYAASAVVPSAPADRAAVLRELADQQEATATTDVIRKRRSIATARRLFAVELRRMADETPQPETPDVVAAIVAALQKRAGELSELAEEQMRPSLEERAQEWHEAADVARRTAKAATAAPVQEAPAPFTPPAHYRRDDGVDCCVHTTPVGPDSCPACRELADAVEPS